MGAGCIARVRLRFNGRRTGVAEDETFVEA